jgi:hypothetical protein
LGCASFLPAPFRSGFTGAESGQQDIQRIGEMIAVVGHQQTNLRQRQVRTIRCGF